MTKLYLDDVRHCPNGYTLVRNVKEFKDYINTNGVPELISFDHDLGGDETAMQCIHWLIKNDYCIKDYKIHSANPVGRANIEGLITSWKKFKGEIE